MSRALAVLLLAAMALTVAFAQEDAPAEDKPVFILRGTTADVEISELLTLTSNAAGMVFIFSAESAQGKVTLVSPGEGEAFAAKDLPLLLQTALEESGRAFFPSGGRFEIRPVREAVSRARYIELAELEDAEPFQWLTVSVPLRHAMPASVVEYLRDRVGSAGARIQSHGARGVTLTDRADRLREHVQQVRENDAALAPTTIRYEAPPEIGAAEAELLLRRLFANEPSRAATFVASADDKFVYARATQRLHGQIKQALETLGQE